MLSRQQKKKKNQACFESIEFSKGSLVFRLVYNFINELIHSDLFKELFFQEYNCHRKIVYGYNSRLLCYQNIQFVINTICHQQIWSQQTNYGRSLFQWTFSGHIGSCQQNNMTGYIINIKTDIKSALCNIGAL